MSRKHRQAQLAGGIGPQRIFQGHELALRYNIQYACVCSNSFESCSRGFFNVPLTTFNIDLYEHV